MYKEVRRVLVCFLNESFSKFVPYYYIETYIKEYYYKRPSMFKLVQLFNTENYITMSNLGKFIFNSMKLRTSFTITC